MKKVTSFVLASALVLSLFFCFIACKDGTVTTSSSVSEQSVTSQVSSKRTPSRVISSQVISSEVFSETSVIQPTDSDYGAGEQVGSMPSTLPVYKDGSMKLIPRDLKYGYPANRKYRMLYYRSLWDFGFPDFQTRGGYYEIRKAAKTYEIEQYNYACTRQERDEMLIVTEIKKFKISREEMEEMLISYRESLIDILEDEPQIIPTKDRVNTREDFELPNLDIIYTLDNDIINEYYRYA